MPPRNGLLPRPHDRDLVVQPNQSTVPYDPGLDRRILQASAEAAIKAVWEADGGPYSALGLPLTEAVSATQTGDGWRGDFRSGSITLQGGQCQILTTTELVVRFVGLECNVRQEATDELYGVVGVVGPANRKWPTYSFPGGDGTVEMGPEGMRFWTLNQEVYRGPIEDVILVATLVEHDDFADVEEASRKIADKIAELGAQVVGTLTGLPAESATDETWFRDGLAAGVGFVLGDILGMGDDPYPGQSLRVPWEQIVNGVQRQPPRTRDDDPKQIPLWTHRVKVTGRDDADDFGNYDFYFDLEIERIDRCRYAPVP